MHVCRYVCIYGVNPIYMNNYMHIQIPIYRKVRVRANPNPVFEYIQPAIGPSIDSKLSARSMLVATTPGCSALLRIVACDATKFVRFGVRVNPRTGRVQRCLGLTLLRTAGLTRRVES